MKKNSRIYVSGHTGLVGSAIVRELERRGYNNILKNPKSDLRNPFGIYADYVFNCAAHAGGILEAINKPAEMLRDNLLIQTNIIDACQQAGVKKLLNLGSSCVYPVDGQQPYTEEQLGTGKTDENWSYAIAKLAGIELCRAYNRQYGCNFMTAIPCNLYGPNDNFDLEQAHVIPALIRKFYEANDKQVEVWGDGTSKREFLYVDDFAKAAIMLMGMYNYEDLYGGVVNVGSGEEITINDLCETISDVTKNYCSIKHVLDKPAGIPSRLMDSCGMLDLGWVGPETSLKEGIEKTYRWYLAYRTYN